MLRSSVLALRLARPLVDAQRFRFSQTGCLLDQIAPIAAEISCGRDSTVTFAVEWYGADPEQLQSWLEVAGCSRDEARREAAWVSDRCRAEPSTAPTADDDDDDDAHSNELRDVAPEQRIGTTLANRADSDSDSDVAPTSTYNPYVVTIEDLVLTCMTKTSLTTTVCTSTMAGNKFSTSCTTYPTEKPTCAAGLSCAFAADTGALHCYEEQGLPVYGGIVLGILALAVAFMVFALGATCCADRRRARQRRDAAAGGALLAASAAEDRKRAMVRQYQPLGAAGGGDGRGVSTSGASEMDPYDPPSDTAYRH